MSFENRNLRVARKESGREYKGIVTAIVVLYKENYYPICNYFDIVFLFENTFRFFFYL